MAVVQILNRYYEGLSTDDKPTGVIGGSKFQETDTRRTWITYDGTNWVVSDKRVRLVEEDGTYIDLPGEFDALIDALSVLALIVDAIRAVTDAEPVLEEAGGSLTTDGNEQTIYVNESPAGVFRPVCLKINFTAHTAGETVVIKEYYRITPGGDYVRQDSNEHAGVPTNPLVKVDLDPNRYGVRVTMQKTVGTNRAYPWEVFSKVH